jgi:hypothetical protein
VAVETYYDATGGGWQPCHVVDGVRVPGVAPAPAAPTYTSGLDLGQAGDYSALAILEGQRAGKAPATYDLRHLQRWQLGTSYPQIVADVDGLMAQPPVAPDGPLVLDQTGCGRPVFDMFKQLPLRQRLVGVTITAGAEVNTPAFHQYHVPKADLIGQLQVLLQSGRLRLGLPVPAAATLRDELKAYQRRITAAAHVQYGQWREGQHDDLVLAVALACWWAEYPRPRWGCI